MAKFTNEETATATTSKDFKKADAFLNLNITTSKGEKRLGHNGLPLYLDDPVHAVLIKMLDEGVDPNAIMRKVTARYHRVDGAASDDLTIEL